MGTASHLTYRCLNGKDRKIPYNVRFGKDIPIGSFFYHVGGSDCPFLYFKHTRTMYIRLRTRRKYRGADGPWMGGQRLTSEDLFRG